MTALADAFRRFKTAERAAVQYSNDSLTRQALQRERARRLAAARDDFRAGAPQTDPASLEWAERKRQEALDALAPTDADSVALIGNEWAKVEALLDSGRNLEQLIVEASPLRLSAILDRMPTRLIVTSTEPDAALAEVTSLALDRLETLEDPAALLATGLTKTANHSGAWGRVIQQATTPFEEVGVPALTALYNASPEDYEAVQEHLGYDAALSNAIRAVDAAPGDPGAR